MTVRELRERLAAMPDDALVVSCDPDVGTYTPVVRVRSLETVSEGGGLVEYEPTWHDEAAARVSVVDLPTF